MPPSWVERGRSLSSSVRRPARPSPLPTLRIPKRALVLALQSRSSRLGRIRLGCPSLKAPLYKRRLFLSHTRFQLNREAVQGDSESSPKLITLYISNAIVVAKFQLHKHDELMSRQWNDMSCILMTCHV